MRRMAFVACSKTKLDHPAPAAALYSSALFRKSLLAALQSNDTVFILSALHGLLPLDRIVSPYDVTLKNLPRIAREDWAEKVGSQLANVLRKGDVATFYCGEEYTRPLRRRLENLGCKVFEPLGRLSFGARLSRLSAVNQEDVLHAQMRTVRRLMRRLWVAQQGGRTLAKCGRGVKWPERGVYIILEPTILPITGMPRVTRIGTHAVSSGSKTTLWNRLSTHRGTTQGLGSHRSSIFRSHIGKAIMASTMGEQFPSTWGEGQTATKDTRTTEEALERLVSSYIGDLSLIWLDVPGEAAPDTDRAFVEQNLISLYSRLGFLYPSTIGRWLGERSPEWRIASTGLWNLNHALGPLHNSFPLVFEHYVEATIGKRPQSKLRVAPEGWYSPRNTGNKRQLLLFPDAGGRG